MIPPSITYDLSPRAQQYLDYEHSISMIRDPERRCTTEVLQQLLQKYGLPLSQQIIEFEKNIGGWCSSHSLSPYGLGVYLSLQEDEFCSAVAKEFRESPWLFEGKYEEPDEDGEYSPLWGTGYPRAFFLDRALVPAGMQGSDEFFFIGVNGEIYNWISPLDKLVLVAGSGKTFIETTALRVERRRKKWFEIHLCADVSKLVQSTLALPLYEPATDQLFTWWVSDSIHLCWIPDYPPCIQGTFIACEREADLRKVIMHIKDTLNVKRIRVWRNANVIDDWSCIDSLRGADIDYEELCGPGPGHCNTIYESSLFDLRNWS